MQINNINNHLSFGRVIRLETNFQWNSDAAPNETNSRIRAIIDTVSGKESSMYDKDISNKIGETLKSLIIDYKPESGIYIKDYGNKTLIFTGEDAIKLKKDSEETKRRLINTFEKLSSSDNLDEFEQLILQSEMLQETVKAIIKEEKSEKPTDAEENGKDGKPETVLKFNLDSHDILESIEYSSTGSKDGTIPKKDIFLDIEQIKKIKETSVAWII